MARTEPCTTATGASRRISPTRLLRTSTFQFAALYMAIFAGSVVLLLGLVYWMTAGFMARQTDATIETEIIGLQEQYRQRGLNGLAEVISDRMRADPGGSGIYLFANSEFVPLGGNLERWPDFVADAEGWLDFSHTDEHGNDVPARARLFVLRGGLRLLVGREIQDLVRTEALIRRGLIWGLGLSVALGLLGGLLMSRRVNHRIELINQASREIMDGDLSRRIPEQGTGDEFDELGHQLNIMLDRIESLMGGVRHVADNVAHDLRTPLTRLRARLEVLRADSGTTAADDDIQDCIAEADRLLKTFNALLRIARIESGGRRWRREAVALDRLITDAIEMYQALAEDQDVSLVADAHPASVRGDRDLLFQALVNLIDNGLKYTPPGGTVTVSVTADDGETCLQVRDTGPGIPDEQKHRVIERFFRLDDSRSEAGSGLGLSLVAAVAEQHGARLTFADAHPGLIVRLCFLRS